MAGTWIRMGLSQALGGTILPSQVIGCWLIGALFASPLNKLLPADGRRWKSSHWVSLIYDCLVSGFCGSLTTFSGWMGAIYKLYVGGGPAINYWLAFTEFYVTLGMAYAALWLGMHTYRWVFGGGRFLVDEVRLERQSEEYLEMEAVGVVPDSPNGTRRPWKLQAFYLTSSVFAWTLYLLLTVLGAVYVSVGVEQDWSRYWWATVLCPYGTFLRFSVSKWLIAHSRIKVLGTFVSNVGGTFVYALMQFLTDRFGGESAFARLMFGGVQNGFCGCLTTLSTFIVELVVVLPPKQGLVYLLLSVLLSQVFLIVCAGVYQWSTL